jgi:tRNA A-37 threonylcarbamoyl transferase component Bud32
MCGKMPQGRAEVVLTRRCSRLSDHTVGAMAPGTIVGRYIVVSRLGAGTTGVVYAALDPELARQVALKVLHVRGDGDAAASDRARQQREAQAMARLSHRNTVAVYDVGVMGDAVYLAMELVRGTSLRQWLASAPRTLDRIADVMSAAGEGLWAAHRQGVLHRDFSAKNVLVGEDGRVCVGDFGLAAPAPSAASTDAAREDQHAWCIVLREAIDGASPRGHVPRWLRAILERGLAPTPSRRFATMGDLLAAFARGRRRTRRVAWLLGGTSTIAIVVALSLRQSTASSCPVPTPDGWAELDSTAMHAAFARARPTYGEALATWVAGSLDEVRGRWRETHGEICEATWLRGEQSAARLDARMACMRRTWDRIRATTALLQLGEVETVARAVELVADLPSPEACRDETALADDGVAALPTPTRRTVEQGLAEIHARRRLDRDAEAARALDRLEPQLVELGDPRLRIEAMLLRGRMLDDRGEPDAALVTLHEAAVWARSIDAPLLEAEAWIALANAVGYSAHDFDEGRFYGGLALAAIEHGSGGDRLRSWAETALGTIELVAGDDARAEALWQSALDRRRALLQEPHHLLAASLNNLGGVAYAKGDNARAGDLLERAMAMREQLFGAEHPSVAESAINLALVRTSQGRVDDANRLAAHALVVQQAANGDDHPNTARAHDALAGALEAAREHADALAHAEAALAIYAKAYGAEHPASRNVTLHRARALVGLGRVDEARVALESLRAALADGDDPALRDEVAAELAALITR